LIIGSLYKVDNNHKLFEHAMRTSNTIERMRGLLGRQQLTANDALIITPCSSVHTIGMRYPIDLIYLDDTWEIKKIVTDLSPWRASWALGAKMVIETMSGIIAEMDLTIGNKLRWEPK
jgi:uncharacterized protein